MSIKAGFIGLGRMGLPMAYRLLNAGFALTVHNRSQEKVRQIVDAGAQPGNSAAATTQATDIVMTCLPDIATVDAVFLGADGIIAHAKPGQILIDHSTVGMPPPKPAPPPPPPKARSFSTPPSAAARNGPPTEL